MEPWPISVAPNWIVITSSAPILTQALGVTASLAVRFGGCRTGESPGDISQALIIPVAPTVNVTPTPCMNSRRVVGTPVCVLSFTLHFLPPARRARWP